MVKRHRIKNIRNKYVTVEVKAKLNLKKYIEKRQKLSYKNKYTEEILKNNISEELLEWSRDLDLLINAYLILCNDINKYKT